MTNILMKIALSLDGVISSIRKKDIRLFEHFVDSILIRVYILFQVSVQ